VTACARRHRGLRTVALGFGLAALIGCSTPMPQPPWAGADAPPEVQPPAPAPRSESAPRLEVEAPGDLRALLQRHLDLARLVALGDEERPDEAEWLRLVAAAPAQARQLLQTEGYFAPDVRVRREAGPPQRVIVTVAPGPRARVKATALDVAGPIQDRAASGDADARAQIAGLRSGWPLRNGAAFRNEDWSKAKSAMVAKLRAAGYASASVSASGAEVDTASHEVTLTLTLNSGPRYLAGGLHIDGMRLYDEATVRHLAGFGPGAPLTEELLLDYQDRLRKSGLFESAVVTFEPDPSQPEGTLVVVQLQELPLQSIILGVGISANTGPRTSIEHTHRRIFGTNATVHNKIEWGRDRQFWEGELNTHPGEGFYRNQVGGRVERLESDTDVVRSETLRVGRLQDTQRIERLYFIGLDRSVQTAGETRKDAQAVSGQYHGVWRRLDNVILPREGVSVSAQLGLGWARSNYAENGPFTRLYGRFTGYLPLGRSWESIGRIELGNIRKSDNVAVPDVLAFRAGGDDSVRGYPYRSLAPTDANGVISGGSVLATGSIELAHPLTARMPSLLGAVFVDAGRAANDWTDFRAALGYGVGLRWRSPVGPLRLDWAYGEELRKGRLHFSVGIAF
jgi:translocation and assembly module TamA